VTPLYPQKLALTSPTGGGRSVGIVRSRAKATEFFFYYALPEALQFTCAIHTLSIYVHRLYLPCGKFLEVSRSKSEKSYSNATAIYILDNYLLNTTYIVPGNLTHSLA